MTIDSYVGGHAGAHSQLSSERQVVHSRACVAKQRYSADGGWQLVIVTVHRRSRINMVESVDNSNQSRVIDAIYPTLPLCDFPTYPIIQLCT